MGAKEAVYLMQKCGLNARITGYGTVRHQSITAGARAIKGDTVRLTLKP
jgi:cell division protein FtsI (penicillin-binding protein 3)